ncbi:MAG TPA: sigma-70 family RNA polymerase sigma factor [Candidatus Polarisedimenticolia bacterium]|nr:sigma-70 family RNA polymerase sigma factor [Candidatus Polarisedimenticolia bacterium]
MVNRDDPARPAAQRRGIEDRPPRPTTPAATATPESLIEEHGDLVYNLAVRLTGDREEARDLAQESFMRIFKGAESFRGEASLRTWICRIVINCHRNRSRWWRRRRKGQTFSLDEPLHAAETVGDGAASIGSMLADDGPSPERVALGREARRRVEQELGRLPADQRAAIVLREIEGLSYSEIAIALGVREGTIKSRLSRARDTLRAALADMMPRRGDAT